MKTVNISELKDHLSRYLQCVKDGEEIVVRSAGVPVARILPYQHGSEWNQEEQLVASGALKMPKEEKQMDWKLFFLDPAGDVAREIAVEATIESRGDR